MPNEISLNDADIRVARMMDIDPKAIARLKFQYGKGGLASGVALLSMDGFLDTGLGTGKIPPPDPGRLTDKGGVPIRTIIEPEDSDDETVGGPDGSAGRPRRALYNPGIGITYPNGETSETMGEVDDDELKKNRDAVLDHADKKKKAKRDAEMCVIYPRRH
ncbi:MAG TPA: hypothetical protein VN867_05925 [Candidatus Binataceae bacterium]|nr:hypothetical protein [Candidatus Binataceae bacterium]